MAEQGDSKAQYALGFCYYSGTGVAKDDAEAVKWYRKAAEQGNTDAQFDLGVVTKDDVEAVKWYRKAAEQGNAKAQFNLGFCYEKGTGVAKDDVEAVKWYRKAAEQGQTNAQFCLASCLVEGKGVAQDLIEAYALLNLAGIENEDAREARAMLDKTLTASQQAQGQQRTKELQAQIEKSKSE